MGDRNPGCELGLTPYADLYNLSISWWWAMCCLKHVETEVKWNIYLFDCIRLVFLNQIILFYIWNCLICSHVMALYFSSLLVPLHIHSKWYQTVWLLIIQGKFVSGELVWYVLLFCHNSRILLYSRQSLLYSKIPLIQITQHWTGAKFFNMPLYQMVSVLTYS